MVWQKLETQDLGILSYFTKYVWIFIFFRRPDLIIINKKKKKKKICKTVDFAVPADYRIKLK